MWGEFSALSPLTLSLVSGIFLLYWLCHMISCRTPSPTRIFPRLGTQHPPANCPMIQKQHSSFRWLCTVLKNSALDLEEGSPMKLASFNRLHQTKMNSFPNTTGYPHKEKNKLENIWPSTAVCCRTHQLSHDSWCWKKKMFTLTVLELRKLILKGISWFFFSLSLFYCKVT